MRKHRTLNFPFAYLFIQRQGLWIQPKLASNSSRVPAVQRCSTTSKQPDNSSIDALIQIGHLLNKRLVLFLLPKIYYRKEFSSEGRLKRERHQAAFSAQRDGVACKQQAMSTCSQRLVSLAKLKEVPVPNKAHTESDMLDNGFAQPGSEEVPQISGITRAAEM